MNKETFLKKSRNKRAVSINQSIIPIEKDQKGAIFLILIK